MCPQHMKFLLLHHVTPAMLAFDSLIKKYNPPTSTPFLVLNESASIFFYSSHWKHCVFAFFHDHMIVLHNKSLELGGCFLKMDVPIWLHWSRSTICDQLYTVAGNMGSVSLLGPMCFNASWKGQNIKLSELIAESASSWAQQVH